MSRRAQLQRGTGGESGLVSLELALLLPLLLFLFAGALTVGHSIYVRHELTQQANRIARACVVGRFLDEASCAALGTSVLAQHAGRSWYQTCGGAAGTRVLASVAPPEQGDVGALVVTVACDYGGIVGPSLLEVEEAEIEMKVTDFDVSAKATLPFAGQIEAPLER